MQKNTLNRYVIVASGDMSLATVTSSITNIQFMDNIGVQVNILSGTATGTFDVQVSLDYTKLPNGSVINSGNWISLGSAYQVAVTSGSPANIYFNLTQLSATNVRLLYTKGSGTGIFEAYIVGKSI